MLRTAAEQQQPWPQRQAAGAQGRAAAASEREGGTKRLGPYQLARRGSRWPTAQQHGISCTVTLAAAAVSAAQLQGRDAPLAHRMVTSTSAAQRQVHGLP